MAKPIRLSVVIPTYNRGGRIVQCLDALVRQAGGWDDAEVIVVDDHREGLRPLLDQVYWYGHGSGPLNCKARRRPLRLRAPVKALSAAAYLFMTPLYVAWQAASRPNRLEGAAFGCIDGLRRAAYALGKARGLWRGFA